MILPSHSQRYLWDGFWNLQDMSGWYLQLEVQNLLSKIRVAWNRWFPEIGVAPTHSFSWDFHRIFPNKDHPAIGVPPLMETLRSAQITVQDHDYHDIYIYITIQIIMYHYAIYIYMITNHTQITVQITVYIILDMFRMFHPTRILTPHWRPYFFWWLTSKKMDCWWAIQFSLVL